MTGTLTIRALRRWFPGADAPTLTGVDLQVPAGGCVALLGPSGSGKSTVLRLVAGLDVPDGGDILVDDRSVARVAPEERRTVLAFQSPRLFPHLSVLDNVAFPLLVRHVPRRAARADAERFLDLVGLVPLARRRPSSLSGGQEQRVALARALAARPEVLLLDEPFSALDPSVRTEMHQLLAELRAAVEPTIVLVTHDRHEAAVVADTVAVLLDGRIAQHAAMEQLYARPSSLAVHGFLGGSNAVPGHVVDGRHRSALGDLALPATVPAGEGPATLVIRQEALRLVAAADPVADVVATVTSVVPAGARSTVVAEAAGVPLEVETGPGEQLRTGDRVGMVLPVAHRHVCATPDDDTIPPARQDTSLSDGAFPR